MKAKTRTARPRRANPRTTRATAAWIWRRPGTYIRGVDDGIVMTDGATDRTITGGDAEVIAAVFDALALPQRQSALKVPGLRRADVAAVLDLLTQLQLIERGPAHHLAFASLAASTRKQVTGMLAEGGILVSSARTAARGAQLVTGPFVHTAPTGWDVAQAHRGSIHIVDVGGNWLAARTPSDGAPDCVRCAVNRLIARQPRADGDALLRPNSGRARAVPAHVVAGLVRLLMTRTPDPWAGVAARAALFVEETGTAQVHPYLRHATCSLCAGTAAPLATPSAPVPLDDAKRDAILFDPRFGPLFSAELTAQSDERFRGLPLVWGGIALIHRGRSRSTGYHGTVGTGASLEHRRRVVAFEGVERYALRTRAADVENVPFAELGERAVDPRALPLYDDARYALPDFPFRPFSPTTPLRWVRAQHLGDGSEKLLPWEAVAVDFASDEYPSRTFETLASSGAAAHRTRDAAVLGAGREVIERDAFMITWLRELVPPRVSVPTQSGDGVLDELWRFLRERIDVEIFDLRLDFPLPTICAIGTARDARGTLVAGSRIVTMSGGSTANEALRRALMEMVLHWEVYALSPSDANAWRDVLEPVGARAAFYDMHGAGLWTLDPRHRARFRMFDAAHVTVPLDSIAPWSGGTDTATLARAFVSRGFAPWVVDITPADLAWIGARAIRLVVPGLVPLEGPVMSRRVPIARVEEIAARLGTSLAPNAPLNPTQHPLI